MGVLERINGNRKNKKVKILIRLDNGLYRTLKAHTFLEKYSMGKAINLWLDDIIENKVNVNELTHIKEKNDNQFSIVISNSKLIELKEKAKQNEISLNELIKRVIYSKVIVE